MPSLALFSRFQDRSSWGLESSGSWVRGELLRTLASRSIAPCAVIASNGSWTPANGIAPAVASSGYEGPSHSLTCDLGCAAGNCKRIARPRPVGGGAEQGEP